MRTRTLSAAIAAAIAIPAAAHADTRVGLGAAASAEASGLSADLDLGPVLLEATAAATSTSTHDTLVADVSYASVTAGALARLAHRDRASLYAGLRVDLTRTRPANSPDVLSTEPMLGVPLRLQLDVTPWLSIDAETAIVVIRAGGVRGGEIVSPSVGFTVWF